MVTVVSDVTDVLDAMVVDTVTEGVPITDGDITNGSI